MAGWSRKGEGSATRGWADAVAQSVRDLHTVNAPEWAAALAFYAVLSLFPLLVAAVVSVSYVADAEWVTQRIGDLLHQFLPRDQLAVDDIVSEAIVERRRVGLVSVIIYLVTGRRVLGALTKALNLVSDVDEHADSIRRRALVELALLVGIGSLFLLALSSRSLLLLAWETARFFPGEDAPVVRVAQETVRALLLFAMFSVLYAVVPRGIRRPRAVMVGSAAATLLFLLAHVVFAAIMDRLWQNLALLYGSLAAAALLLLWAWYVALITLAGGALASHVKVMLVEGHSQQEAERRHVTRLPSRDTLG